MHQIVLKNLAVAASALSLIALGPVALGPIALSGTAWAAPALSTPEGLGQVGSLIIPAKDEETRAVEEDLRPDEVPEAMKDDGGPAAPATEPSGESGGGNIEEEMIDKIGPGAE